MYTDTSIDMITTKHVWQVRWQYNHDCNRLETIVH